jgi:hypothetical protein
METLELFANDVMPEFKERDKEAVRKKAERMRPVIEKVMARKPASDHPPMPKDYEIVATPRAIAEGKGSREFNKWLDEYAVDVATGKDISERLAGARTGLDAGSKA